MTKHVTKEREKAVNAKIKAVMASICKRKIYSRAMALFDVIRDECGGLKENSGCLVEKDKIAVWLDGSYLEVITHEINTGDYWTDRSVLVIEFNYKTVFEAVRTLAPKIYDGRRVFRVRSGNEYDYVAIETFKDGRWVKMLNKTKIIRALFPNREPKDPPPNLVEPVEDTIKLAKSLGIR